MKNLFLSILFSLLFLATIFAQENEIKPVEGDVTSEVNFSPFSSNPIRISHLTFRIFDSNGIVKRVGVSLGGEIQKPDEDITQSTIEVSVKPGVEKHYEGTDRLSPYTGAEVELGIKVSRLSADDFVRKGAWDGFGAERGFVRAGVNFIVGADYYFTKKVYIGTEFGYGFMFTKFSDIVEEINGNETGTEVKGGSAFQFGPNYNGSFRLGFVF